MLKDPCRCGARHDKKGLCVHCDYPPACKPGSRCTYCPMYARHCQICKTKTKHPEAAQECEYDCRVKERKQN